MSKSGGGFEVQLPRSLKAERRDDIAVLFLARPEKRNAIDDPTVFGIEAFFAALPPGFLERSLRYVNNAGIESADPAPVILPHFFNHQTHHRAQVHTLLSQLGRDPPVLDLHRVLRPNPS